MVREFQESDLREIKRIHSQYHEQGFSLPEISEAYANAVVEYDGKILGFGVLRDITESIMILDLGQSMRTKSQVLTDLIKESVMKSHHRHIHSFIESPKFENVLKKHYGYKTCQGAALYLET